MGQVGGGGARRGINVVRWPGTRQADETQGPAPAHPHPTALRFFYGLGFGHMTPLMTLGASAGPGEKAVSAAGVAADKIPERERSPPVL